MKKYISFLRGINVGGKNRIKMTDLQIVYQHLGFTEIKTYIQSGNVIFSADKTKNIFFAQTMRLLPIVRIIASYS